MCESYMFIKNMFEFRPLPFQRNVEVGFRWRQKLNGTQANTAVYFVSLREEERGFEWRLPLSGVCQILPQAQVGL